MKKLLLHQRSFGLGAYLEHPECSRGTAESELFYRIRDGLVINHFDSLYIVAHTKLFLKFEKLLPVEIKKIPGD